MIITSILDIIFFDYIYFYFFIFCNNIISIIAFIISILIQLYFFRRDSFLFFFSYLQICKSSVVQVY